MDCKQSAAYQMVDWVMAGCLSAAMIMVLGFFFVIMWKPVNES
jgi:ABC-type phosphate transport system auxiliary subunit